MFHAVGRGTQMQAFGSNGLGEIAPEIATRAHLHGGPIGKAAVIHGEAVVMLEHGNYVLRAGLFEQARPRCGSYFSALNRGMKSL